MSLIVNAIMTVSALLSRFFVGRYQIHGFNEVARLIIYCIFDSRETGNNENANI